MAFLFLQPGHPSGISATDEAIDEPVKGPKQLAVIFIAVVIGFALSLALMLVA